MRIRFNWVTSEGKVSDTDVYWVSEYPLPDGSRFDFDCSLHREDAIELSKDSIDTFLEDVWKDTEVWRITIERD